MANNLKKKNNKNIQLDSVIKPGPTRSIRPITEVWMGFKQTMWPNWVLITWLGLWIVQNYINRSIPIDRSEERRVGKECLE